MSQTATILVIDDEPQIRKFLRISLVSQGYKVLEAGTGTEGLAQAALNKPDLLVLDLGLPDMDGQQVLREFREWSTVPVLVLSVRAGEGQKVEALDGGANDYVTKPFGIQEFLARVRALLRQVPAGEAQPAALTFGPLTVDLAYRRVLLDGTEVALTRKEYAVLAQLARHSGRVITQQQLLKDIWGPTHTEDSHYLRIVVGHLRQKLADDPHPYGLSSVWLHPQSGGIVRVDSWRALAPGERAVVWIYPLHSGQLGGAIGVVITAVGGLTLLGFGISGTWLWWLRRPKPARNPVPAARQPSA